MILKPDEQAKAVQTELTQNQCPQSAAAAQCIL